MMVLQVNTALSVTGSIGGTGSLSSPSTPSANAENLQDAPRTEVAPSNAVQPGPPVSRLDIRTQNQAQDVTAEDQAESTDTSQAQLEEGERTNEDGEKVNEACLSG